MGPVGRGLHVADADDVAVFVHTEDHATASGHGERRQQLWQLGAGLELEVETVVLEPPPAPEGLLLVVQHDGLRVEHGVNLPLT